jgi:transposase
VSIDETSLSNGELYTIVSNKDAHGQKGSLIAIVKGTKVEDVIAALNRIHFYLREKVKEITMDFSDSMHVIATTCFPNATITLDRFHMQQLCTNAMQQIRVKERRVALKADAEAREQHRFRNKRNVSKRKKGDKDPHGRKPKRANEAYVPERLSNGDTRCELLSRSRYLLMVSQDKWTESQKARGKLLFELYPDIKKAYSLVHSLREIFNCKTHTKESARESLGRWYNKVTEFDNAYFNVACATIYEREDEILNFFTNRATNASAESFNSKIKAFRAQLRGVVDIPFFLYRLVTIFA